MILPIGTLIAAFLIVSLGIKGFQRAGFPVTRKIILFGQPAHFAGVSCFVVSFAVFAFSALQLSTVGIGYMVSLANERESRRAIQAEQDAIKKHNQRVGPYNQGFFRYWDGKYQDAADLFTESLRLGSDPQVFLMRARCRNRLGEFRRTIDDCSAGLAEPHVALEIQSQLHGERGYAYYRLGKFNEARKEFDAAISQAPQLRETLLAYLYRGWICAACSDPKYRDPIVARADGDYLIHNIGMGEWQKLDLVAAMYARARDFYVAQYLQRGAVKALIAKRASQPGVDRDENLRQLRARLRLYEQEQSYHEVAANRPLPD